jgi:hypothetical protein
MCLSGEEGSVMLTAVDELFRRHLTVLVAFEILTVIAIILALVWAVVAFARIYLRYQGKRVITCPETGQYAAVDLDAPHAAFTCLWNKADLRLTSCTRWPERRDCEQDCIQQIGLSPFGCQLRAMLTGWYKGKQCTYCHRAFDEIHWLEHQPALLAPGGKIVEWESIRPEAIPEALFTHQPVCWDCKVVEGFCAEHAELVVERPWKHS